MCYSGIILSVSKLKYKSPTQELSLHYLSHKLVHAVDTQLTNNNNNNKYCGNIQLPFGHTFYIYSNCERYHFLDYVLCWDKPCHNHKIRVNGRKGTSLISPSVPIPTLVKCASLGIHFKLH